MNKTNFIFFSLILCLGCSKKLNTIVIPEGTDPNFKIVSHQDKGFTATNRKVDVFGIPIYAYEDVEDEKLLHAANVMAQYLDNDEDGVVDNPILITTLLANNAALFMWKKESQIRLNAQDLGADETVPEWHSNPNMRFDASLEEVWHVITHSGYSKAYPEVFGENENSQLAKAMDIARGGVYQKIPSEYPTTAWYTYDDRTCTYDCQVTEYFYWGMTSILGAQKDRLESIDNEWRLNTKDKVAQTDALLYQLLTDSTYQFPTILPNGKYRQ
ncbi:hypothetical protein [Flammeovirga sp. SubArs3]|uniref:hypothetical protein n=1 Tax=Flammeovirga sp. SubArs3 TaxID=2995316 RepID=UPI00248B046E|nr:hypothetical protein [Flammeovirga sp. SubArs3]